MKQKHWFVEVYRLDTGEVIKAIDCDWSETDWKAEKVERGVLINMNRDDYGTRIVGRTK